ncbi:hypothetical protein AC249_AIPGENE20458, partial [Exaiptasia diaphana]
RSDLIDLDLPSQADGAVLGHVGLIHTDVLAGDAGTVVAGGGVAATVGLQQAGRPRHGAHTEEVGRFHDRFLSAQLCRGGGDLGSQIRNKAVGQMDDAAVGRDVHTDQTVEHRNTVLALGEEDVGGAVVGGDVLIGHLQLAQIRGGQIEGFVVGVEVAESQVEGLAFLGAGQEALGTFAFRGDGC